MKQIERFSIGIGDRFAHQGAAQLAAFVRAREAGVTVIPVWNKSNREHNLIGTEPDSVRAAADAAVRALGWSAGYHVDADHIGLKTVDRFLAASDFFTIDVADFIGTPAPAAEAAAFAERHRSLVRTWTLPGSGRALEVTRADLDQAAAKYAVATREAGSIYGYIARALRSESFIAEVSMDETDLPQQPGELLIILAALAAEGVNVQTIAPKFTGRFNKGVDYVGDLAQFQREFEDDVDVLALAVREFGLPPSLKLSVHSGSDKFSIYPAIAATITNRQAGLHLKTAGTTWLAEVEGLAAAGGDALELVKHLYADMYGRIDELSKPYATVIDIDRARLPTPAQVTGWTGPQYVAALRHEQADPGFNPHFRQLIHVGFKVAAEHGAVWRAALVAHAAVIGPIVTDNLYRRHLAPLFGLARG
jgi:hypothetical protein